MSNNKFDIFFNISSTSISIGIFDVKMVRIFFQKHLAAQQILTILTKILIN